MAENSKIEWTDHTWNPWVGCTKVSIACDNCYAEGWSKRAGREVWGPHNARERTKTWGDPIKWNAALDGTGRRERVFVASLADVFDNHKSILPEWRAEMWELIEACSNLDFLLLTKRPQNIKKYLPDDWGKGWDNVWLGTTVENQAEADRRIPHLLLAPSKYRFLSCEPLVGYVDLFELSMKQKLGEHIFNALLCDVPPEDDGMFKGRTINWVIAGGESGPGARPMHPDWARSLRDQCKSAGVPFFFKQWGEWAPGEVVGPNQRQIQTATWWVDDWHIQREGKARPDDHIDDEPDLFRVGKKLAGRCLDGQYHNAIIGGNDA